MRILLFEDTEKYGTALLGARNRRLAGKGGASLFCHDTSAPETGTHADRLRAELSSPRNKGISVIVADRDLSKTEQYLGLSEATVREVALDLALPECAYARAKARSDELMRVSDQSEATIGLSMDDGEDALARQVVSIAQGFALLAESLPKAVKESKAKPASWLVSAILGKHEYSDKFALYASGDLNRRSFVTRVGVDGRVESRRRQSCLLGYWLWDSVLRYPGLVVNEVAASSYLNISEDGFHDARLQRLFSSAAYNGPFAAALGPMWWRGALDDIIANARLADGREFASKKLGRSIPRSRCCEDPKIPAGYYCMLSRKPVSLQNSYGSISWFPRGADLARVSKSKYDELGPWL
jgi:hypothetical protein